MGTTEKCEDSSSSDSSGGSLSAPPLSTPVRVVANQRRKRDRSSANDSAGVTAEIVPIAKRTRLSCRIHKPPVAKTYGPWIPTVSPEVFDIHFDGQVGPIPTACYTSITHIADDVTFKALDCVTVLAHAAGAAKQKMFIGRIIRFLRHPDTGDMMAQIYWYYRPGECVEYTSKQDTLSPAFVNVRYNRWTHSFRVDERELFASMHTDLISCETIVAVVYVLKKSEYNRYSAELKYDNLNPIQKLAVSKFAERLDSSYERRRLMPFDDTPIDAVFFSRFFYNHLKKNIRRKPMKAFIKRSNPRGCRKHKKVPLKTLNLLHPVARIPGTTAC